VLLYSAIFSYFISSFYSLISIFARGLLKERGKPAPGTIEFQRTGRTRNYHPDNPYSWSDSSVANILELDAYLERTTNFKTAKLSYKSKKTIENPPDKWAVFEGTHEAIIDKDTWEAVQKAPPPYQDGGNGNVLRAGVLRRLRRETVSLSDNFMDASAGVLHLRYLSHKKELLCSLHPGRGAGTACTPKPATGSCIRPKGRVCAVCYDPGAPAGVCGKGGCPCPRQIQ